MCGTEDLSYGLHQGISHNDRDITSRVTVETRELSDPGCLHTQPFNTPHDSPIRHPGQISPILLSEITRCSTHVQLEHSLPRLDVGQGNVDSFFESTFDGRVELPWNVGSTQDEDSRVIVTYTLHLSRRSWGHYSAHVVHTRDDETTTHLNEELGLDPSTGFALPLASCSRQRIDFVDKDDGGFTLPCHLKQLLDEPLRRLPSRANASAHVERVSQYPTGRADT